VSLLGFSVPFLYQSIPEMGWDELYATVFFVILSFIIQYNSPFYIRWREERYGRDKREVKEEVNGKLLLSWITILWVSVSPSISWYHGFCILFTQLLPIWWLKKVNKPDDEKILIIRSFLLLLFLWVIIPLVLFSLHLFHQ
jgi:hypothetical protein